METEFELQEESTIDLQMILNILRRWAWVIALSAVLAGLAAFIVSKQMTPVYEATTTVLINEAPSTKATDYTAVMASERIARTYSEMLTKRPVMEGIIERLGMPISATDLAAAITVTPVRDTQLITIKVENTNPDMGALIANTLVDVFSEQIMATQTSRYAASKQSLEKQMSDLDYQISLTRAQIAEASNPTTIDRLEDKISRYEQSYNNLALSYEQVRLTEAQTISSVVQVEQAAPPETPVRPKVMQNTALAAVVGMMLALGAVFLVETLNDTIKDPDEITKRLKLPILAMIGSYEYPNEGPVSQLHPRSFEAEAFRVLRTNVQYTAVDEPIRSILVTSPTPSDGKTTVAANLAVVSAQGGRHVTLLDADLHRPRVHKVFNTHNRAGLSSLLVQTSIDLPAVQQDTKTLDLKMIGSGPIVPNPSELLGSRKMQTLLNTLTAETDLVVVDTPPVLSVTDAVVIAPHVDAVLLVVKPEKTNIRALKQAVDQLNRVGAKVIGVVLNEVQPGRTRSTYYYPGYYTYHSHYDGYATPSAAKNGNGAGKKQLQVWSKR